MTSAEARESLRFHSGSHPDVDDPRWSRGFLGMLRPYGGLRETSFHEVMRALRELATDLQNEMVDREVVSALFGICHLARAWGIHPDGMLRRNGLIAPTDVERLERWVWTISYATSCVLDGSIDEAFAEYDRDYGVGISSGGD
jgi:hypothetical protein